MNFRFSALRNGSWTPCSMCIYMKLQIFAIYMLDHVQIWQIFFKGFVEFPGRHDYNTEMLTKNQCDSKSAQNITDRTAMNERFRIATDWTSLRNCKQCTNCQISFDCGIGVHCRRCGHIFCERCYSRTRLPGHYSQCLTPVCTICQRQMEKNE